MKIEGRRTDSDALELIQNYGVNQGCKWKITRRKIDKHLQDIIITQKEHFDVMHDDKQDWKELKRPSRKEKDAKRQKVRVKTSKRVDFACGKYRSGRISWGNLIITRINAKLMWRCARTMRKRKRFRWKIKIRK